MGEPGLAAPIAIGVAMVSLLIVSLVWPLIELGLLRRAEADGRVMTSLALHGAMTPSEIEEATGGAVDARTANRSLRRLRRRGKVRQHGVCAVGIRWVRLSAGGEGKAG